MLAVAEWSSFNAQMGKENIRYTVFEYCMTAAANDSL
jgi:hypothetical protein